MNQRTRHLVAPGHAGPPLDDLKLQAARLWVAQHRPYYAAALFRCPIVVTDEVPRLAVDEAWRIYVNPAYVNDLTVTRLAAALVHEVNHVLRDHAGRARARAADTESERRSWNVAGDAEINDDLYGDGLDVDIESWVLPHHLDEPEGLLAEQYYAALRGEPAVAPGHADDAECGSGSGASPITGELPSDGGSGTSAESSPGVDGLEARLLRQRTAEGVLAHRAAHGTAPGGLIAWADEVMSPKVDWRRVLAGMVRNSVAVAAGNDDFTYQRFSRRQPAVPNVRLAGTLRRTPTVAVVIDTSGSMSENDIAQSLGEVQGILRSASVADDSVTVLTVDTDVAAIVSATDARQVRKMRRGGTDMRVGIEAALRLRRRPDVLVVITDGETPWPTHVPRRVQVVVVLVHPAHRYRLPPDPPPWARVVRVAVGEVRSRSVR